MSRKLVATKLLENATAIAMLLGEPVPFSCMACHGTGTERSILGTRGCSLCMGMGVIVSSRKVYAALLEQMHDTRNKRSM